MKQDWDKTFSDAHLHSWPTAGISVATNVIMDNAKEVFNAAKKHGYEVVSKNSKQICFINPKLKGLKNEHNA